MPPQLGDYTELGDLIRSVKDGREVPLRLSELEYVEVQAGLDLWLTIAEEEMGEEHEGIVRRQGQSGHFLWSGSDGELVSLALRIYATTAQEGHEYDYCSINREPGKADACIEIIMTDVQDWLSPKEPQA